MEYLCDVPTDLRQKCEAAHNCGNYSSKNCNGIILVDDKCSHVAQPLQVAIGQWSDDTFGALQKCIDLLSAKALVFQLMDEVDELWETVKTSDDPGQLTRLSADCAILLFQLAYRCNFNLIGEVIQAFENNKAHARGASNRLIT